MTVTFPLVMSFYAAMMGLLGTALAINVIVYRVRNEVDSGDGGISILAQALRAHGNFVEQAPLALILIATAELCGVRTMFIHILGLMLITARLTSAIALSRSLSRSPLRQFSGGLSLLTTALVSAMILLALVGIR